MPKFSQSGRGMRGGRAADVLQLFTRPKQSLVWQIVGLLIRARAELVTAAVLVVGAAWMRTAMNPDTVSWVLVVVLALPWTRRYVWLGCGVCWTDTVCAPVCAWRRFAR